MMRQVEKRTRGLAFVLTCGFLFAGQLLPAESNCKEVKASFVDVYSGGNTTSGTITNGGVLNGVTLTIYTSGASSTPVPTSVSYTADLTITTNQGLLKTVNLFLYDFATGLWTAMGRIDSNGSTGRFAGATGVLYFNGKTIGTATPFTYLSDISGQICFSKD